MNVVLVQRSSLHDQDVRSFSGRKVGLFVPHLRVGPVSLFIRGKRCPRANCLRELPTSDVIIKSAKIVSLNTLHFGWDC